MAPDPAPPQPTTIQRLSIAVYPSFAMLAGMQLDVFTPLKDGPLTAAQLAAALSVTAYDLSPLLYALVAAELLTVEEGCFANTAEAQQFLVQGTPTYIGGRHASFSDAWETLLHTAESIRSGMPQAQKDFATMAPEDLLTVLRGLHSGTLAIGRNLVARYDFSAYRTLVDVGGGSGGMALALTAACPQLRATVIDLPSVTPLTQRFIEEAGAAERVQVAAVDVVRDALPSTYDVAVMRAFLHVLSPDDAWQALQHIGAAIKPGGRIYIIGRVLDDSRLSPLGAVGFNLMLLNQHQGRTHTEGEHRQWLTALGFAQMERTLIAEDNSIITARKSV
jgi:SAM-dependent methyltransferase